MNGLKLIKCIFSGRPVDYTVSEINGKYVYTIIGIYPNIYELILKKENYMDVVFKMESKITEAGLWSVPMFDMGNINIISKNQMLRIIFTWRRISS